MNIWIWDHSLHKIVFWKKVVVEVFVNQENLTIILLTPVHLGSSIEGLKLRHKDLIQCNDLFLNLKISFLPAKRLFGGNWSIVLLSIYYI